MRWLRVVPAALLLLACVVVLASTWGTITNGEPAYGQLLLASIVMSGWLIVSGLTLRTRPRKGWVRLILRILGAAAVIGLAVMLLWLKPFVATPRALDALGSTPTVTVTDTRAATVFNPVAAPKAGLVLYPGARIDPRAYAVLARGVASKGYRVVVVKCPLNISLLCLNAANHYITRDIPWAVGGHSLGGVVAAEYAKRHDSTDGLVLWASFPFSDLSSRTALTTASISGSRDGLSTPHLIADHTPLLPSMTVYTQIRGAVHSYFGDYGLQPGDNLPTIPRAAAQRQIIEGTVRSLARMKQAWKRSVETSTSSTA